MVTLQKQEMGVIRLLEIDQVLTVKPLYNTYLYHAPVRNVLFFGVVNTDSSLSQLDRSWV